MSERREVERLRNRRLAPSLDQQFKHGDRSDQTEVHSVERMRVLVSFGLDRNMRGNQAGPRNPLTANMDASMLNGRCLSAVVCINHG